MKKTSTQKIVYGAVILAMYAVFMLIDRYMGGMLYAVLYYFLPLPFIVYGLKYGTSMFGSLAFCSVVLGFMFGLAETAFFGMTAIAVSYVISNGILKDWNGTKTMLLVMLATVSSQILSITAFAGLFGYDLVAELQSVVDMMSGMGMVIDLHKFKIIFAFSTVLLGCLEAFLFTTLTDLVLLRLKMARVPRFSILNLRFSKVVGILFIVCFYFQSKMANDLLLFAFLTLWMMILAQGISYCFFLNAIVYKKPILNGLAFILAFVPVANYFITAMGLIDIFSENRKKLMYNEIQRGDTQ